ncbi:MAG: twin-arginine translocase subunit TatC [bacterium]|nr:twin-arginine translocase subunit TatC [bacterium]
MSDLPRLGSRQEEDLPRMGLLDHLGELRRRLVRALAAFTVTFLVCFAFSEQIYAFLARPIYRFLPEGSKLVFLGITDPFILYIKVAALAGIFLGSPLILYQLWAFVAPGLYKREKRMAIPFIFFGTLLFLGGGAFGYYIAFPFAVEFLLSVGEQFQPTITVTSYLSFLMTVILGLGVMFEMPTIIFLLTRLGVVTPRFLLRHFRWAVLIIFAIAAIITPTPDVVNLCIFALPTLGLYLIGVAVAWMFTPGRKKEELDEAEAVTAGE